MEQSLFVHGLPNLSGAISFWFTCNQPFALVAASVPSGERTLNWQAVYRLASNGSNVNLGQVIGGRGLSCGGFDGIKYCQLARAGERLAYCANLEAGLIYVLTQSAEPPVYTIEEA
jgi:hypothetical protein